LKKLSDFVHLFLSISGFVPGHATAIRTIIMAFTFFFTIHLINSPTLSPEFAVWFFLISTTAYIAFLYVVLPKQGWRLWLIREFGPEEGFLTYEAILSFLFFINGTSIGYISAAFEKTIPFTIDEDIIQPFAIALFMIGWGIKIWAAKVVGVDIYYWKDMFYGKKISDFVEEGPYKFINNPMYGLGQLQTYATAVWYLSWPGLIAAVINQLAVFSFYHFQEKKFIKRVYLNDTGNEGRVFATVDN
jgi:protein-S-isoprenylcysteine O-methyltransferase Ste14